ncbi:MAG TPA: glycosyltransferase, partial [Streptosporangiaceae bacterium]|nr:glycosyltransferase [Streptosporangiaceae bacterium]
MPGSPAIPRASVVIPTYNRQDSLRNTLETMTEQDIDAREFEVIVADDGSSDRSAEVALSFAGRLRLKYCFHEDEGFRVAAARNAGARLAAAPLLIFLDSGALAGPGLVRAHLDAHTGSVERRAVIGYSYGYNAFREEQWMRDWPGSLKPAEIFRKCHDHPLFTDIREQDFIRGGSDPMKWPIPWLYFFTGNCSVPTTDFWAVGGFDEMFRSWGAEDVELGYRLFHNGIAMTLSSEAWMIELPVKRPVKRQIYSLMRNGQLFLGKHPDPYVEIMADALFRINFTTVWDLGLALQGWTREARDIEVSAEIEAAVADLGTDARMVIFGCGPSVPPWLPPAVLADFDAALLARATGGGKHAGHHAIGLRTSLP